MSPLTFSDEDILEIMKARLSLLYTQKQDLNQRAQLYITVMSAAMAFAGGANVFTAIDTLDEQICAGLAIVAYGIGLVLAFAVFEGGTKWQYPFDIEDVFQQRLRNKKPFPDSDHFDTALETYRDRINNNQGVIRDKTSSVRIVMYLTIAVFIATLLLVAFP